MQEIFLANQRIGFKVQQALDEFEYGTKLDVFAVSLKPALCLFIVALCQFCNLLNKIILLVCIFDSIAFVFLGQLEF